MAYRSKDDRCILSLTGGCPCQIKGSEDAYCTAHLTSSQLSKFSDCYTSIKARNTAQLTPLHVARYNESYLSIGSSDSSLDTIARIPAASLAFVKRQHITTKICVRGPEQHIHAAVAFTLRRPRSAATASQRPADLFRRSRRRAKKSARPA